MSLILHMIIWLRHMVTVVRILFLSVFMVTLNCKTFQTLLNVGEPRFPLRPPPFLKTLYFFNFKKYFIKTLRYMVTFFQGIAHSVRLVRKNVSK